MRRKFQKQFSASPEPCFWKPCWDLRLPCLLREVQKVILALWCDIWHLTDVFPFNGLDNFNWLLAPWWHKSYFRYKRQMRCLSVLHILEILHVFLRWVTFIFSWKLQVMDNRECKHNCRMYRWTNFYPLSLYKFEQR